MEQNILLSSISPNNKFPSVFELLLLDQLDDLSQRSCKHLLRVISSTENQNTIVITKVILEFISIWFTDSLISENLYGLQRNDISEKNDPKRLNLFQKVISFIVDVFIPQLFDIRMNENSRYRNILTRLKILKAIWSFIIIWYRVNYAFDLTTYLNPVFEYYGIGISRENMKSTKSDVSSSFSKLDDSSKNQNLDQTQVISVQNNNSHSFLSYLSSAFTIKRISMLILVVGIKTLETYSQARQISSSNNNIDNEGIEQTADSLYNKIVIQKEFIPPPSEPSIIERDNLIDPPDDPNICGLCMSTHRNPCVSTGGYVFCYNCLINHIHENPIISDKNDISSDKSRDGEEASYCPITGIPCRESDIIWLYENQ